MKKETKTLDWKWILISVLAILVIILGIQCLTLGDKLILSQQEKETVSSSLNEASGELDNYLLTHDCYERNSVKCYDKESYCYDTPKVTASCDSGYRMACVAE